MLDRREFTVKSLVASVLGMFYKDQNKSLYPNIWDDLRQRASIIKEQSWYNGFSIRYVNGIPVDIHGGPSWRNNPSVEELDLYFKAMMQRRTVRIEDREAVIVPTSWRIDLKKENSDPHYGPSHCWFADLKDPKEELSPEQEWLMWRYKDIGGELANHIEAVYRKDCGSFAAGEYQPVEYGVVYENGIWRDVVTNG